MSFPATVYVDHHSTDGSWLCLCHLLTQKISIKTYGFVFVTTDEHTQRCIFIECAERVWWHHVNICPLPSPEVAAFMMHAPGCKDLLTIPVSWKHPDPWLAFRLTRHGTDWTHCSGSACTTLCSSSCQYPKNLYIHWRGMDHHSTKNFQLPHQLCAGDVLK